MRTPTYQECLAEAYAEYVRWWYQAHPITAQQAEVEA